MLTGTLTLLTAVGYVAIYTPLKQVSTINTFIGTFPGAMPPLIGWTAARGLIEWPGVALFAILFLWQFPHFMAIGWMYREDYARAGIRITPTITNTRYAIRSTVLQALFYAALMVPVSLWPYAQGTTGVAYAIAAVCLSLGYLWCTIRFARIGFGEAARAAKLQTRTRPSTAAGARPAARLRDLSAAAAGRHDAERPRPSIVLNSNPPRTKSMPVRPRKPTTSAHRPASSWESLAVSAAASALICWLVYFHAPTDVAGRICARCRW